jgi:zinc finger protein
MQVAKGRADLLRRQVVKSNTATVTVPELQFEIPPGTQKGVITTMEGLLTDASAGLR